MEAELPRQDSSPAAETAGPRSTAYFEFRLVSRVEEYLRQYMYDSAVFLSERLVAELPTEVRQRAEAVGALSADRSGSCVGLPSMATSAMQFRAAGERVPLGSLLPRFQPTSPRVPLPERFV